MAKIQQERKYFCYYCGHERNDHRKMVRMNTMDTVYLDCIKPIGHKATGVFKLTWIDVCRCTEFQTKEKYEKKMSLPND